MSKFALAPMVGWQTVLERVGIGYILAVRGRGSVYGELFVAAPNRSLPKGDDYV